MRKARIYIIFSYKMYLEEPRPAFASVVPCSEGSLAGWKCVFSFEQNKSLNLLHSNKSFC